MHTSEVTLFSGCTVDNTASGLKLEEITQRDLHWPSTLVHFYTKQRNVSAHTRSKHIQEITDPPLHDLPHILKRGVQIPNFQESDADQCRLCSGVCTPLSLVCLQNREQYICAPHV